MYSGRSRCLLDGNIFATIARLPHFMQNPGMNATAPPHPTRPFTLAFIGPTNLFDEGSGAAQSVRTMLEQLALRGVACHAVTACSFDAPPGAQLPDKLRALGLAPSGQLSGFNVPVWQGRVRGVGYDIVQFMTQQRDQMTAIEELLLRDAARTWLDQHRPDVVVTYGGYLLDLELRRCARAAGALVAFYLANPRYNRPETFANVDLVLANSAATADLYAGTMGLRCHNVGLFVDADPVVATPRTPRFVTFINPLPEKGVTLFLKLVQRARQEAPEMRFLVVESRGALAPVLQHLGYSADLLQQVTVLPKQVQMGPVYAQTRILLVPSFWFEAAGRVLLEGNANGIPVLATNRGGIPETLGGAGKLLPIPERCASDHLAVPSDAEVQPWWDELLKLWRDDAYYETCAKRALEVAQTQTLAHKAENLLALLQSARAAMQAATQSAQ